MVDGLEVLLCELVNNWAMVSTFINETVSSSGPVSDPSSVLASRYVFRNHASR